tara:strand:- start:413 stop:1801 length:1389 start_codon:yes stop_codon:yes gene_type:complete
MDLDSNTLAGYYGLNDQQAPAGNALSGNLINNSIDNPISFPSLDSPLGGSTRSRGQKLMGMGGGADLPTKLRALGAMFSNQVPEFRQQMMQENEAESRLAVQGLQKREMLDKSLAKDYFTAFAMAENNDYQGFMDLMEDRLQNERKLGLDTSSTLEIMQDAQGPDGMATVMPYLKSTLESAFAAGYLTPAEMSKPIDRFVPITNTDMDYLEQQGVVLDRSKPYQREINSNRIFPIGGDGTQIATTTNVAGASDFLTDEEFTQKLRRENVEADVEHYRERGQEAVRVIELANDVGQMMTMLNDADMNTMEQFALDKFGLKAASLLDLGPESEAVVAMQSYMAPRMRPVGSGSTSDMEVRMYMNSLPNIIGSPEGRAFTAAVFQAKANIERAVIDANRKWRNNEIDVGEWLEINERLRSQSIFTTETERREIEKLVPDFFKKMANPMTDNSESSGSGVRIIEEG